MTENTIFSDDNWSYTMSIAIVTDTACNFTPEMAPEPVIYLLPIEITFEDKTYKDNFEITNKAFYEKMAVPSKY